MIKDGRFLNLGNLRSVKEETHVYNVQLADALRNARTYEDKVNMAYWHDYRHEFYVKQVIFLSSRH